MWQKFYTFNNINSILVEKRGVLNNSSNFTYFSSQAIFFFVSRAPWDNLVPQVGNRWSRAPCPLLGFPLPLPSPQCTGWWNIDREQYIACPGNFTFSSGEQFNGNGPPVVYNSWRTRGRVCTCMSARKPCDAQHLAVAFSRRARTPRPVPFARAPVASAIFRSRRGLPSSIRPVGLYIIQRVDCTAESCACARVRGLYTRAKGQRGGKKKIKKTKISRDEVRNEMENTLCTYISESEQSTAATADSHWVIRLSASGKTYNYLCKIQNRYCAHTRFVPTI